jgi:hypothetical protein
MKVASDRPIVDSPMLGGRNGVFMAFFAKA